MDVKKGPCQKKGRGLTIDRSKGAGGLGWLWAGRGSQMNLLLRGSGQHTPARCATPLGRGDFGNFRIRQLSKPGSSKKGAGRALLVFIFPRVMEIAAQGRGSAELEVLCRPRNRRAGFVANPPGQGDLPRLSARLGYEGRRAHSEFGQAAFQTRPAARLPKFQSLRSGQSGGKRSARRFLGQRPPPAGRPDGPV